jgi:hypothetical protein
MNQPSYDTQTQASSQSSLHFISETGTEVKIHEPHDEAKLIRWNIISDVQDQNTGSYMIYQFQ